MKITRLTAPDIYSCLTQLSEKSMNPAKSDSKKDINAIRDALKALKTASEQVDGKVEKQHRKYFGDICEQDGSIQPLALPIIKNLEYYRKNSWCFEVQS